jgi:hypothetical protein
MSEEETYWERKFMDELAGNIKAMSETVTSVCKASALHDEKIMRIDNTLERNAKQIELLTAIVTKLSETTRNHMEDPVLHCGPVVNPNKLKLGILEHFDQLSTGQKVAVGAGGGVSLIGFLAFLLEYGPAIYAVVEKLLTP